MRTLAIALLAGAGALSAGSASASDIYTSSEYTNPDLVQQVRMVCDDSGRCYRTRGGSRTYRDWDDGPRAGVGIRTPGVSVGVGVGSDRW